MSVPQRLPVVCRARSIGRYGLRTVIRCAYHERLLCGTKQPLAAIGPIAVTGPKQTLELDAANVCS